MYISRTLFAAALLVCTAFVTNTEARLTWGLTSTGTLFNFDTNTPATITTVPITNLGSNTLVGIDVRPATGVLYGVARASGDVATLVTISNSGAVTNVGTLTNCPVTATDRFTVDFNPVADALRIIGSNDVNYRVTGLDGALTCNVDGTITPAAVSVYSGTYTNAFRGATSTALYVLASNSNPNVLALGQITTPNAGTYGSEQALSPSINPTTQRVALDSYRDYSTAAGADVFVVAAQVAGGQTNLWTLNAATGALTQVGLIGDGSAVVISIAATLNVPFPFQVGALVGSTMFFFRSSNPSVSTSATITGAPAGETFLGATLRPSTYYIYAMTASLRLYILYPNADLTAVTAYFVAPVSGCSFNAANSHSLDFNPVADLLRVVSSVGANYRINPTTGACTTDGTLFYPSGSPATVTAVGVAYTNGFRSSPAPTTTQEYITALLNGALVITQVTVPNGGNVSATTTTLNGSPAAGTTHVPIDIFTATDGSQNYVAAVDRQIVGGTVTGVPAAPGTPQPVATFTTGSLTSAVVALIAFPQDYATPAAAPSSSALGTLPASLSFAIYLPPSSYAVFTLGSASTTVASNSITLPTGVTQFHGIALRPANNQIYAVGSDSVVYIVYPTSATSTVTYAGPALVNCSLSTANTYSFDFNPVADRLRVVSNNGLNYRINVDNGACLVDGNIAYTDGTTPATPAIVGVAYTNAVNPAPTSTAEYILDSNSGRISQVTNPNGGATELRGTFGNTIPSPHFPFDTYTSAGVNHGFAVSAANVWYVNLTTFVASPVTSYSNAGGVQPAGLVVFPDGYTLPAVPGTTTTTTTAAPGSTTTTTTAPGVTTTAAPGFTTTAAPTTNSAAVATISFALVALTAAVFALAF